jgi:hypothetical protein
VQLAWELTANISSIGDIMRRHGLSFDDLDRKKREPGFKAMLAEYQRQWNSELSVNQRVAIKAALLAEDSLLDVYEIIKSQDTSPGQKLEAFDKLARAGEVGVQKKEQGSAVAQVKLTINVPGKEGITIDSVAIPVEEK